MSAYTHPTTSVIINGIKTSIGIVADRLKTIDESHIEYLFEKLMHPQIQSKSKIREVIY